MKPKRTNKKRGELMNKNNLSKYLKERGISKKWFASKLGCSVSYLIIISNRKALPSPFMAKLIEIMTDGHVKAESFLPYSISNEFEKSTKNDCIKAKKDERKGGRNTKNNRP